METNENGPELPPVFHMCIGAAQELLEAWETPPPFFAMVADATGAMRLRSGRNEVEETLVSFHQALRRDVLDGNLKTFALATMDTPNEPQGIYPHLLRIVLEGNNFQHLISVPYRMRPAENGAQAGRVRVVEFADEMLLE
jgi:hypothetical protein